MGWPTNVIPKGGGGGGHFWLQFLTDPNARDLGQPCTPNPPNTPDSTFLFEVDHSDVAFRHHAKYIFWHHLTASRLNSLHGSKGLVALRHCVYINANLFSNYLRFVCESRYQDVPDNLIFNNAKHYLCINVERAINTTGVNKFTQQRTVKNDTRRTKS